MLRPAHIYNKTNPTYVHIHNIFEMEDETSESAIISCIGIGISKIG